MQLAAVAIQRAWRPCWLRQACQEKLCQPPRVVPGFLDPRRLVRAPAAEAAPGDQQATTGQSRTLRAVATLEALKNAARNRLVPFDSGIWT